MVDPLVAEEQKQATIFITLVVGIILVVGLLALFNLLTTLVILIVILVFLIMLYQQFPNFFAVIKQYQRAVVFRWGRFKEVAEPGWLFVIPFIESFRVVDMRERMVDLKEQMVVTEDNIELEFDVILYMKVTDAKKAVIEVEDYKGASRNRVQARLRAIAGNMRMTEIVSNIDKISGGLFDYMQQVEEEWGIQFPNVEIREVKIPETVQNAVQKRRAAVEEKTAQIERAKGAKGEIDKIREAADQLGAPALQYYYLEALKKISEGKSSKIIFPLELSKLAGGLSNKIQGLSFGEAQDKLSDKYHKLKREGKDKDSVIEELKKEIERGELEEELEKEIKKNKKKNKKEKK
ncbi:MAG: SPFH domain-containing protein [archaeon]